MNFRKATKNDVSVTMEMIATLQLSFIQYLPKLTNGSRNDPRPQGTCTL
jgi:hypothetical protein